VFNVNVFQLLEVPNFQEAWVTAGAQARSWVCAPTVSENSYRQDGGAGLCLR
jgi:hypothetical protein